MLVVTRKVNEVVRVGADIAVKVVSVRGGKVMLGVQAPRGVAVDREEIFFQNRPNKMPRRKRIAKSNNDALDRIMPRRFRPYERISDLGLLNRIDRYLGLTGRTAWVTGLGFILRLARPRRGRVVKVPAWYWTAEITGRDRFADLEIELMAGDPEFWYRTWDELLQAAEAEPVRPKRWKDIYHDPEYEEEAKPPINAD